MLGLVNDWVERWMGHVLQQVWMHEREGSFQGSEGRGQKLVLVRWKLGGLLKIQWGEFLFFFLRSLWLVDFNVSFTINI